MKFKSLEVYIQVTANNDLKARVVMEAKHGRTYGRNLLKGFVICDCATAQSKIAEILLGKAESLRFTFQPCLQSQAELFVYPSEVTA